MDMQKDSGMKRNDGLLYWFTAVLIGSLYVFLFSCSILGTDQGKPSKVKRLPVSFHREAKNKVGKGGFAYKGVREKFEIEDFILSTIDRAPQSSSWFESEKKAYTDLLRNKTYDVLVVPFQTQLSGVDPTGRSLMTYRLAAEIEQRTELKVAPLPLVQLSLGSHSRFFMDEDIYALAERVGVSDIIWGFAGTSEDEERHVQALDITIVHQQKENFNSLDGMQCKKWANIDVAENKLPSMIFEARIEEMMKFLNLPFTKAAPSTNSMEGLLPAIPESPELLFQSKFDSPIAQSYLFQLMGMLIPPRSEYQRQYMFIRSLTALSRADPDHPAYATLKARAYHHLNRRPAALAMVRQSQTPSSEFLRHLINGNLPPLKQAYERLPFSMDKLFAAVEYSWLTYQYTGKQPDTIKDIWLKTFPKWQYFWEPIFNDRNSWDVPNNLGLKQLLDEVFHIDGFEIQDVIRTADVQRSVEDIDLAIAMAFHDHIRKFMAQPNGQLEYVSQTSSPNVLDQLTMLDGIGVSNLLKRLRFLFYVQGLPEESMRLCQGYLKKYHGHPYFTLLFASIQKGTIPTLQDVEKNITISEAFNNAVLGLWWYGRQGWAFKNAHDVLTSEYMKNNNLTPVLLYKDLLYGIASDYPFLPDCARKGYMRLPIDLIDWSCCDPHDLISMASIYRLFEKEIKIIQTKAEGRFSGHPKMFRYEIMQEASDKPDNDPKAPYIQIISQGTKNWKVYRTLGGMYLDEGNYEKAQKVYLSYPGFQVDEMMNRVKLSNYAYSAGTRLFWRGAYNEARPLYEFSANLDTGSAASLTSRARLAIMDKDLTTAAEHMHRRAKRYDVSYGYRDAMSFWHMMGGSERAWNQFEQLLGRFSSPHIWTSAFVGHRIQKSSKTDLVRWIKKMAALNQTSRQRSFPARFALMCLLDRSVDMEMASFVADVDDLSKYDFSRTPVNKGPNGEYLGPEHFGRLYYTKYFKNNFGFGEGGAEFASSKKRYYQQDVAVPPVSFYGSFAVAYENLKSKNYSDAFEIMKKMSLVYSYSQKFGKPLKSYLVWAGMNCGADELMAHFLHDDLIAAGLSPHLTKKPDYRRLEYDDELALAAYNCRLGKNDRAIEELQRAFNKRPHTEKRPVFSYYQLVELCEWLYEYSNDRRYLDLALKWVRDYQVIQPMFGWAFAFEAKHTDNEKDRLNALGWALYLDSQSSRIAHFSSEQKEGARKWFRDNNPFKSKLMAKSLLAFRHGLTITP